MFLNFQQSAWSRESESRPLRHTCQFIFTCNNLDKAIAVCGELTFWPILPVTALAR